MNVAARCVCVTFVLAGSTAAAVAADAPPAHHIRGTLTAVSPSELTVKTDAGPVTVRVDDATKVLDVVPASFDDIASGTFIGTANVAGNAPASSRALEVVVFPPSMAGAGEGDYPWDLPAPANGHSSMTNGTVQAGRSSMMTNGTVMGVNDRGAKTVTLQYKGGSKMVTISPNVPIVRIGPGTKSELTVGAHVVAFPSAGGAAARVVVGKDGAVPPM